ncbi:hypothetical protein BGX30_008205, partial [Mortierella sp. GBA39]
MTPMMDIPAMVEAFAGTAVAVGPVLRHGRDDVLAAWAQKLASEQSTESELLSFVIENVEVLEAFEDEADKAEIRAVLEVRPGELLQELNDSERAYLALFAKDPKE